MTVNGVAPGGTFSKLLLRAAEELPIEGTLPLSSSYHVGLAIVYSAVAQQTHAVERYGKDTEAKSQSPGRWNGRVIFTGMDKYIEVEEPCGALWPQCLDEWASEYLSSQQVILDQRGS